MTFVCHDRVGQGGEVLCHGREFDVVTRLPEIVSRLITSYVMIKSFKT